MLHFLEYFNTGTFECNLTACKSFTYEEEKCRTDFVSILKLQLTFLDDSRHVR